MVAATAGLVDAPSAHALDDVGVRHLQFHHVLQPDAGFAQGFGLRDGARETVEQVAVLTVGLLQPFLHQADDDVVGHQLALVHHFLGGLAQLGAGLDGGTQHVARGDLGNAELAGDEAGLGTFASARRAKKNQSHGGSSC